MEPEAPFRGQVFSVTAITMAVKQTLEGVFRGIFVEGEITNLREPSSGHIYFDLKDREALLPAVMFKYQVRKYGDQLQEGMQVRIGGNLTCYPKQGKYQLVAETAELLNKGNLFLEFEKLKKKLEAEGLFDPAHKKPIPAYPQRIAVITSPTGAAVRDILSVLKRRSPHLEILILPTLVQGDEAAPQIAQALQDANTVTPKPDVILVGRGGGSMEDLWVFNEEIVARAIFNSDIPVISCVGHEIDYTIADFVADLRAPTPSAAAELVVKNSQNTRAHIAQLQKQLLQAVSLFYERAKNRYERTISKPAFSQPETWVQNKMQEVDDWNLRLEQAFGNKVTDAERRTELLTQKLAALGPQAVLKRGYSITRKQDGTVISRVSQTRPGETIYVQVQDGMIYTEVK